MEKDDLRFDKRVIDRNLRSGVVSEDEFRRYLKKLRDVSEESALFETSLAPVKRKVPRRPLEDEEEEL